MGTGEGQVKQLHLMEEVLKVDELARALKARILDSFVKKELPEKSVEPSSETPAPEPNPIDYLIHKSVETQHRLKSCLELLEVEIINKLEGK